MDYFYAGQLRQYRLQFIRAFSNFYVNFGSEDAPDLRRVPCRYGDSTRIAESVVRGNSENKVLSTPFISCIISALNMNAGRRHDPSLVEKVQVNERLYDEETQRYTSDQGQKYTVERYMPVPYDLTMQVDIWTSNLSQKEQLIEQIFQLYNPAIDFQTSNNPLDWTFLSYIEMQDSITWTSRSIPVGTENPIDVLTVTFKLPIWINPPAKVKKQSLIHQIVTSIIQGQKNEDDMEWTEYEFLSRVITTPGNYGIRLTPNGSSTYEVELLSAGGYTDDTDNLATLTYSKVDPILTVGTNFKFNGIQINVNTSDISEFVDNAHTVLTNTQFSIKLHNKNCLCFINNSGGDNVFEDVTTGVLQNLGIQQTTYKGKSLAWWRLFEAYGSLKNYSEFGSNASQLRVKTNDIEGTEIVGWLSAHPTDQNKIIWTLDSESIPTMSMLAVNAIIDPQVKAPGYGLSTPAIGQRYLLTNSIPVNSATWGSFSANPNDIIQFTEQGWTVSFDSVNADVTRTEFVNNLFSGKIYTWSEQQWSSWLAATYRAGHWRLSL